MSNWLRGLLPRQDDLFPRFEAHAARVDDAAARLRTLWAGTGGDATAADLERAADEGRGIARIVLEQTRQSFVTPFDRSDIKRMTASMQALLEDMRSLGHLPRDPLPGLPTAECATLIAACASELKDGVARLRRFDEEVGALRGMRERIGTACARVFELRDEAMGRLLTDAAVTDARALIAAYRLLERLAGVARGFDAVADHIDDLVLDHV